MSQQPGDTIAAISSAVGPAARMIVRASGPQVRTILQKLTGAPDAGVSSASRLTLRFAGLQISAWVYLFIAPRSVTGEDVLELHVPGNPLLARMLLDELFRMGARQAEPGEFTSRAYFNGRLDLTEAEGVAATIAAQSERELAAARQLMAGELARRLRPVLDSVAETLALIEVGIDFSEEEVTFLSAAQIGARVQSADESLRDLLSQSSRFERLAHEPQIVLVGRPNAGKSTLLNALAGHERAVVSPHAGTTRDAIWAHVPLSRGTVRLIDVAGIDPSGATSPISKLMQQQTLRAIEEADAVVLVRDCTDHRAEPSLPRAVDLIVDTKADLLPSVHMDRLHVSARSGINMDELRLRLDRIAFGDVSSASTTLALNARHVQAIDEARQSLTRCREQLQSGAGSEILAMDLREALDALGQVLGSVSPDDPLTRIFSNFCIGK